MSLSVEGIEYIDRAAARPAPPLTSLPLRIPVLAVAFACLGPDLDFEELPAMARPRRSGSREAF